MLFKIRISDHILLFKIIVKYKPNIFVINKQNVDSLVEDGSFPCNQCDKSFTLKSSLHRHKESLHEGIRYTNLTISTKHKVVKHQAVDNVNIDEFRTQFCLKL